MIKLDSNTTYAGLGILFTATGLYFKGELSWQNALLFVITSLAAMLSKAETRTPNVPVQDPAIPKGK